MLQNPLARKYSYRGSVQGSEQVSVEDHQEQNRYAHTDHTRKLDHKAQLAPSLLAKGHRCAKTQTAQRRARGADKGKGPGGDGQDPLTLGEIAQHNHGQAKNGQSYKKWRVNLTGPTNDIYLINYESLYEHGLSEFVNGKKVPNDQIYNISSDCVRITTDIQSTYNVSVMMYRDIITDLVGLMNTNTAAIDQLVNSISESELNRLNSTFTTITDVEDRFVIDTQKISIINEIVRDFWMRPGINQGVPFLYDYDTDAFIQKDTGDNWIIPAMDATLEINIVEEPEDEIVYGLDLPHPEDDPYYDKMTFKE